jgi:uncharacterized membrane protein
MDPALDPTAVADDQLRRRTVTVLQAGFRLAVALVTIGLVLALVQREALPHDLGNPVEVAQGVVEGDPGSVLGMGIIGVILTPLVATLVIAVTFFQQGDRRYGLVSSVVLLILLTSISLSLV